MFDWFKSGKENAELEADTALPGDRLTITAQSGLLSGTHVASNLGWRKVEALSVGDKVLTFDNSMQTITDIRRETLFIGERGHAHPTTLPVHVPKGALYNRCDLWLMPEQGLLIESDAASDALGDPFAIVSAQSLTGFRGICREAPSDQLEITTLSFEQDEVVYAEGGLLAYCPQPRDFLMDELTGQHGIYEVLDRNQGRYLVECLVAEDCARGITYDPEEVALLA
ncbi:MAG: Hint domain-containing protein [Paracoccaceae bacterium]